MEGGRERGREGEMGGTEGRRGGRGREGGREGRRERGRISHHTGSPYTDDMFSPGHWLLVRAIAACWSRDLK